MSMSPRLLRPRASGFNPRSIANLVLWLDGDDSSTVTLETGVKVWADKSGGARNFTQDTLNSQPGYTATLNGKKVVSFNGASHQLNNLTNIINTANATMFVVGQRDGGSFGGYITSMDSGAGGDVSPGVLVNLGNVAVRGDAGTLATGSGGFSGPSVITALLTGYAPALYVAGSLVQSQAASASVNTALNVKTSIGTYRIAAANFLDGYIGEIICYTRALSTTERQAVERYLGKKWGLTVA
jgi:hypothetical protein